MELNPDRKWNMILQQGWSLFLKEKITERVNYHNGNPGNTHKKKGKVFCWRFNCGHCSYGTLCHFEHKCNSCHSTDHGAANCTSKKDQDKTTSN